MHRLDPPFVNSALAGDVQPVIRELQYSRLHLTVDQQSCSHGNVVDMPLDATKYVGCLQPDRYMHPFHFGGLDL